MIEPKWPVASPSLLVFLAVILVGSGDVGA